jgi:phage-related protein
LRASIHSVNYRVLYFFHGGVAAVVSHGIVKEKRVPDREIDLALNRKQRFEADPSKHCRREL